MRRLALRVFVASASVVAVTVVAPAAMAAVPDGTVRGGVQHYLSEQTVVKGFFRGKSVRYLDLGAVKLAKGNTVAPIWVVTNGTGAQRNIIDVLPGQDGYTPLWRVTMVTWKAGVTPRTLKSAKAVQAAVEAGEVRLRRTSIVVNCPVLGFGQPETLGFQNGESVAYLDLGAIKLKPGNAIEPLYAVTNGGEGQRNIIDTVPGDESYTPLWGVMMVTWNEGVTPRVLTSAADVSAALAAGEVKVQETDIVVNCPVV